MGTGRESGKFAESMPPGRPLGFAPWPFDDIGASGVAQWSSRSRRLLGEEDSLI